MARGGYVFELHDNRVFTAPSGPAGDGRTTEAEVGTSTRNPRGQSTNPWRPWVISACAAVLLSMMTFSGAALGLIQSSPEDTEWRSWIEVGAPVSRRTALRASTEQIVLHVGAGIRGVPGLLFDLNNLGYPAIAFYGDVEGKVSCFIARQPCGDFLQDSVLDGRLRRAAGDRFLEAMGEPGPRRAGPDMLDRYPFDARLHHRALARQFAVSVYLAEREAAEAEGAAAETPSAPGLVIQPAISRPQVLQRSADRMILWVGSGLTGLEDNANTLRAEGYVVEAYFGSTPGAVFCYVNGARCGASGQGSIDSGFFPAIATAIYDLRLGEPE